MNVTASTAPEAIGSRVASPRTARPAPPSRGRASASIPAAMSTPSTVRSGVLSSSDTMPVPQATSSSTAQSSGTSSSTAPAAARARSTPPRVWS